MTTPANSVTRTVPAQATATVSKELTSPQNRMIEAKFSSVMGALGPQFQAVNIKKVGPYGSTILIVALNPPPNDSTTKSS